MSKVFRDISRYYGLNFQDAPGYKKSITESDIIHFWHSQCADEITTSPHLGVHLTRDPRDVIVSGFLYHQRTKEAWCRNEDFEIKEDISYPQVDYSQLHLSHKEKEAYLESLNGKSYQTIISSLEQDAGLIFEMDGYAGRTISDLKAWNGNEKIMEVKFEKLIDDFDETWRGVFTHLGFTGKHLQVACRIARSHDMNRMTEKEIANDKHISTGKLQKWKGYFSSDVQAAYDERFDEIHHVLNYE